MSASNAPPVRRTLFKKSAYAKPVPTEMGDADDLFNRSKDLFSSVVREQEREAEEKRLAKLKEARDAEERKRRRTSTPVEEEGGARHVISSDDEDEHRHVRRRSSKSSSHGLEAFDIRSSASSPRKSPRHTAISRSHSDISSTIAIKPVSSAIVLSDSEDDAVSYVKTRRPSAPITEIIPIPDENEEEEEFPELMAAAKQRAEALKKSNLADRVAQRMAQLRAGHAGTKSASTPVAAPPPPPPPVDPVVEFFITSDMPGTVPLMVKRKLSQRLRDVRVAWCDQQSINDRPMDDKEKDTIFLTWKGHRLFDSSTGAGLPGIRSDVRGLIIGDRESDGNGFYDGKVWLQAWTLRDFEEWKERDAKEKARKLAGLDDETPPKIIGPGQNEEEAAPAEPVAEEEKIRIVLVAKDLPEVRIVVRQSTKVEQIIRVFKTRAKVDAEKAVVLRFDGDELEGSMTVQDVDIDDMTKIDVYVT